MVERGACKTSGYETEGIETRSEGREVGRFWGPDAQAGALWAGVWLSESKKVISLHRECKGA